MFSCSRFTVIALSVFTHGALASCPSDVVLILDNSGSVESDFEMEKQTCAKMVEMLNVGPDHDHVSLIHFNDDAKIVAPLSGGADTKHEVMEKIKNLTNIGGNTNTLSALELAAKEFRQNGRAQQSVNRLLVIVTDGNSYNTLETLVQQLKVLEEQLGVSVQFAASASHEIGARELMLYARHDATHLFLKNNLSALADAVHAITSRGECLSVKPTKGTGGEFAVDTTPAARVVPQTEPTKPAPSRSLYSYSTSPAPGTCQCTCAPPAATQASSPVTTQAPVTQSPTTAATNATTIQPTSSPAPALNATIAQANDAPIVNVKQEYQGAQPPAMRPPGHKKKHRNH